MFILIRENRPSSLQTDLTNKLAHWFDQDQTGLVRNCLELQMPHQYQVDLKMLQPKNDFHIVEGTWRCLLVNLAVITMLTYTQSMLGMPMMFIVIEVHINQSRLFLFLETTKQVIKYPIIIMRIPLLRFSTTTRL